MPGAPFTGNSTTAKGYKGAVREALLRWSGSLIPQAPIIIPLAEQDTPGTGINQFAETLLEKQRLAAFNLDGINADTLVKGRERTEILPGMRHGLESGHNIGLHGKARWGHVWQNGAAGIRHQPEPL